MTPNLKPTYPVHLDELSTQELTGPQTEIFTGTIFLIILEIIQHLEFVDLISLCGQHLKDVALVCNLITGQMNQEFQLIIDMDTAQ